MIRQTSDGPLTMAKDMLVWKVRGDKITVRDIVSSEDAWSVIGPKDPPPPDRTVPDQLSEWSLEHRWNVDDVQAEMIKKFSEDYNLKK